MHLQLNHLGGRAQYRVAKQEGLNISTADFENLVPRATMLI